MYQPLFEITIAHCIRLTWYANQFKVESQMIHLVACTRFLLTSLPLFLKIVQGPQLFAV